MGFHGLCLYYKALVSNCYVSPHLQGHLTPATRTTCAGLWFIGEEKLRRRLKESFHFLFTSVNILSSIKCEISALPPLAR